MCSFTGKICKCTPSIPSAPPGRVESIFKFLEHFLDLEVGVLDLVVLDHLLKATSKKRSSTFLRKKVHP